MYANKFIAILVGFSISGVLQFEGAPSYVYITIGMVAFFAVRYARDAQQNLSRKLGFSQGRAGIPQTEPWWVDRKIYALAYMQGRGGEIPSVKKASKDGDHPKVR